MTDEVAAVLERAHKRVSPDAAERQALEDGTAELLAHTEDAIAELPVDAEVIRVGSTARGTWMAGDRDIDLFVRFPPSLDRDELREYGLQVGHTVLPSGREEYAEHPYVTGEWNGFDVDIVPCYDVESAQDIQSAVDRTPFHNEYITSRIDDTAAAEVRLLKGFCTGIGVYGSDLQTRGFSGYLLELLVLEYGDMRSVLSAAADWTPPVELDPADHGQASFEDPLVVIDPTDPERNVAAVLSATNVARFQHYARAFLRDPSLSYFETADRSPLDPEGLTAVLADRETTPVALRFRTPDLPVDDLYPQLRTSARGISGALERQGFDPLRWTIAVEGDTTVLLIELEVTERPAVERHEGPPVHLREHAENFYAAYDDDPTVYGPFIEDGRYVVERPREVRSAAEWLTSQRLFEVKHGAAIERVLEDDRELLVGEEITDLLPTFGSALRAYFDPHP